MQLKNGGVYMEKKGNKKWVFILGGLALGGFGLYKVLVNQEPSKYSLDWIKKLTDIQWETEREKVRQMFCSPKYDDSSRDRFKRILDLFDKVKSERDWAGQKPQGPAFKREHGWYL